jgi:UDP-N-acetylglucosamine--N-acetylmuramyl-(pentapeptide) pyrophosphoryl-undecaprenol N-acetylglucosamine transferase
VGAALSLRIPVVIHEQNAVPGRTNRFYARRAAAVGVTFRSSLNRIEGKRVERTGYPVRKELRDQAEGPRAMDLLPRVLVVGGSQGAQAINEASLGAAQRMVKRALHWTHVTGKAHFEGVFDTFEKLALKDDYEVKSFLEGPEMGEAYSRATLVVGRAGAGTLAELAAFRLPSVLVPYPHAYADHQHHNALEFAKMGAATHLSQSAVHPASLESALASWLDNPMRRDIAAKALESWDLPEAAARLFALVEDAVKAN